MKWILAIVVGGLFLMSNNARAVPTEGLISYYPFDGDVLDTAGSGNDGQIYGASYVSCQRGDCLEFDGIDDYVSIKNSDSINTSRFTVAFWWLFNEIDTGDDQDLSYTMLAKINSFGGPVFDGNFRVQYHPPNYASEPHRPGILQVSVGNATQEATASNGNIALEEGRFYHIVATYDQSHLILYLNGENIGSSPASITTNEGAGDLMIARNRVGVGEYRFCNGIIDDLFIYDRALSVAEIQQFYDVHLSDLTQLLKILAGLSPVSRPYSLNDITNDGRIGIAEAAYTIARVTTPNTCPVLNTVDNKSIEEGTPLSFRVTAFDADLDDLTFAAPVLPEGARFEPDERTLSWIPTYHQSGVHEAVFTVSDGSDCADDSTTVMITVTNVPLFMATEHFPLAVGNWWDYKNESGEARRSEVTGTEKVGETMTYVFRDPSGQKEYYTSDSNGVRLHGFYAISDEFTGDVYFDAPLLYLSDQAGVGSSELSHTSYTQTLLGKSVFVEVTTETEIVGVEDVSIENTVFADCLKVSVEMTQYVPEQDLTISSGQHDYWFYEGVGPVKRSGPDETETIVRCSVDGQVHTY